MSIQNLAIHGDLWGTLLTFLQKAGCPSIRQPLSPERVCADIVCCTQSRNTGLHVCLLGMDASSFEHAVVHVESILWSKRNPAEATALAPEAWKMLYWMTAAGKQLPSTELQPWPVMEQWEQGHCQPEPSPTTPEHGKQGGPKDCGQVQPGKFLLTSQLGSLSPGQGQHQDQVLWGWPGLDAAPGWLGRAMGMGQPRTSAHRFSVLMRHRIDRLPNRQWVNRLFSSVAPTHPVTQDSCHKPHFLLPWTLDLGTLSYKRIKRICSPVRGSCSLMWKIIYLFTVHPNRAIWPSVVTVSNLSNPVAWWEQNSTKIRISIDTKIHICIYMCL